MLKKSSYGSWKDINSQKQFFDSFAKENGIVQAEDWYQVKISDVEKKGGSWILNKYYGGSLVKALATIYPNQIWQRWRFSRVPDGFWNQLENQKNYVNWIKIN